MGRQIGGSLNDWSAWKPLLLHGKRIKRWLLDDNAARRQRRLRRSHHTRLRERKGVLQGRQYRLGVDVWRRCHLLRKGDALRGRALNRTGVGDKWWGDLTIRDDK